MSSKQKKKNKTPADDDSELSSPTQRSVLFVEEVFSDVSGNSSGRSIFLHVRSARSLAEYARAVTDARG